MWCKADNHNETRHSGAKGVLDSNFNQAVTYKKIMSRFSHFHKNSNILKYNWVFIDKLFPLCKFYSPGKLGICFVITTD